MKWLYLDLKIRKIECLTTTELKKLSYNKLNVEIKT